MPYQCNDNLAGDDILKSRTFRIVRTRFLQYLRKSSAFMSYGSCWRSEVCAGDVGWNRIFALWVNMIQNYWTHTRNFGYRRYDDEDDNAMNIGEWLRNATFSACLQNNTTTIPVF